MRRTGVIERTHLSRYLWILVLTGFVMIPSAASGQITFERTYGESNEDWGRCVQATLDGGYIVVGGTRSYGAGDLDIYMVRTDSLGDTLWQRTYGDTLEDYAMDVQETLDGGYILAGGSGSVFTGDRVRLIKTDSQGDALWDTTYDTGVHHYATCVQQTTDKGYIICVGDGVSLVKTDSLANILWGHVYGESLDVVWGRYVQQTNDNGYVIAGYAVPLNASYPDLYLVKTDSLGNTIWENTYGDTSYEHGYCVDQTMDGGYIATGWTRRGGLGYAYLVKTDSSGNLLWERTYGTNHESHAYSVLHTSDSGYIVCGTISSTSNGWELYLVKTDTLGDTLWTRTYGGPSLECGFSVDLALDGGYVVSGYTTSFGAGDYDVYLIKTDENGLTGVHEASSRTGINISNVRLLQNRPNPFRHSTLISYSLPTATEVTLEIYDITGRLVETLVNERQEPGIHQVRWNRKSNPSGVYFYRLKVDDLTETEKMISLR